MKLFVKEHVGLIVIYIFQVMLFSLIIFLSGFRDYPILFYGIFMSLFILVCYLVYHYYRRRHVYQRLPGRPANLQELLEKTDTVPIGQALDAYNKFQYQLYMEKLQQAEDEQANHLKFIDRWVHQMKTPLSVIELTAKELDEPESSNIREETERIENGLNTVLYMARMRTIQEDFLITHVGFEKLIHDVHHANKRFYIRNEEYPHIAIETKDLTVETDERWLFFIVDQLLQNAVKCTADRSKRIDLAVYKKAGAAVLEITDYGVGIPEHDRKRIFQAFFTGVNGRKFRESTGMGLYLAKEVSDYLGHRLEVESTADVGTTFRICFTKTQTLA